MPTLLLLRHGEIAQTMPKRFVGQLDLPLTDTGRGQAEFWGEALAGVPLGSAWCSSLARCQETARIVLKGRGVAPQPLDSLREISLGAWEGLSVEEVRARFPGEHERRGADLAHVAPSGGESFATLQQRTWLALEGILTQTSGIVLIVAHGGVNRALLCKALGIPLGNLFSLGQDYAALNILHFELGRPPRLHALNLPPHPNCAQALLFGTTT